MSQLDDPIYQNRIREQIKQRTNRNSKKPIILPDSGVIPYFPAKINGGQQPNNLGHTGFYQYGKSTVNQGSKPVGKQRLPLSSQSLTRLHHEKLYGNINKTGGANMLGQEQFVSRGKRK